MAYFDRREFTPVPLVDSTSPALYRNLSKRVFDLLMVALLAIPVLVVVAISATLIALDGKTPFYMQERVGRGGRIFRMVKLRSMVVNAEHILDSYLSQNPDAQAEWDEKQKLKNDPRITRVGRFIRKTSLDELPQLWNVLTGDMSLVGPRPMLPSQETIYPGVAYYQLRPGITGLWQVSERNETSFAQRAYYDNEYHRHVSFRFDLSVMLKTVSVVVRANGH